MVEAVTVMKGRRILLVVVVLAVLVEYTGNLLTAVTQSYILPME